MKIQQTMVDFSFVIHFVFVVADKNNWQQYLSTAAVVGAAVSGSSMVLKLLLSCVSAAALKPNVQSIWVFCALKFGCFFLCVGFCS